MLANFKEISVTTDGLTSLSNKAYMDFTKHFIDFHWQLISKDVTVKKIEERHTSENIAHCISEVLKNGIFPIKQVSSVQTVLKTWLVLPPFSNLNICLAQLTFCNSPLTKLLQHLIWKKLLAFARKIVVYFRNSLPKMAVLRAKNLSNLTLESFGYVYLIKLCLLINSPMA